MLNIGDRVLQTTTTQGTGTINLDSTVTGFRSFVSGVGNGKKTVYLINDNTNWEVGIGTITDANPDTLSRTTILSSSNSGAAVNWGPGTRNVYCVMAAPVLPITDENLNFMQLFGAGGGTANAHTVTMPVAPLALSPDMQFFYRPTVANTTAGFTINVNVLGAKAAKVNGADPGIGFAGVGDVLLCVYKASNNTIEILNLSKIGELAYQGRNLVIGLNELKTTVASAATPDIWTNTGNVIDYTGTITTTGFAAAPQAGARRTLICAGAVQFTNGANMIIDGGANYTASAGDRINVIADTTTKFRLEIVKADGRAVSSPNKVYAETSTQVTVGSPFIPFDNTAPQQTEGTEVITVAINSSSVNDRFRITFYGFWTINSGCLNSVAALFFNSVSDAIAVCPQYDNNLVNLPAFISIEHTPGVVGTVTYKIRVGCSSGSLGWLGSLSGVYGSARKATIIVEQV